MKGFKNSTKTVCVSGPGASKGSSGKAAAMFTAQKKGPQGKPFTK